MFEDYKVKIDYGDSIIICDDDINLNSYRSEITPKLMYLKKHEEKVYGLNHYELTAKYKSDFYDRIEKDGYEIIDITEMIREKIKSIVEKELEKYVENNINNITYITQAKIIEFSDYNSIVFEFLGEAYKFGQDVRNDDEAIKRYGISIQKINEGIVEYGTDRYYNQNKFEYDIEKNRFSIDDEEILLTIYSEKELKLILAYEQYKRGLTPPIYNEIAKINEFLKDKKTVSFELKNGTVIKAEANLSNILQIQNNGEIYIADKYGNKVVEGNPINYRQCLGTELKCLKYAKNVLLLDSKAFEKIEFEEQEKIITQEDEEDEGEEEY